MTRKIDVDAENDGLRLRVQGSNPSAPTASHLLVFAKSGGVYLINSAGTVVGPLLGQTLTEQSTPSLPAANKITVFAADDSGVTRLYTLDSAGNNYKIPHLFTELNDAPAAYDAGTAGMPVTVTDAEDGLQFAPLANEALTAQAADISATAFGAGTVNGLYRASYYMVVTTADGAAGGITLAIAHNDGVAGRTQSSSALPLTTTGFVAGTFVLRVGNAAAPTFAISHTGSFGTAVFALYLALERIG